MKKYIVLTALVFSFVFSSVALAEVASAPRGPRVKTLNPVAIQCVGTAVAVREASISSAMTARNTAINNAYSARATALALAYTKTTGADVKAGVKLAWDTFKTSTQSARKTWQTARLSAWSIFKTAVKACRPGSAVPIDVANAGADASL